MAWLRRLGLGLTLLLTAPAEAAEIYLPLLDQAPWGYMDAQGKPAGVSIELINELGRRAGIPVRVDLMPRRRLAHEQANNRDYTAALLAGAAEVPPPYDRLGVLMTYHIVLVQQAGRDATSVDAYLGRQVGLVESLRVLLPQAVQRKVEAVTVGGIEEGLRMLAAGRLDGWFMADVVFRASLAEYNYRRADFGGLIPVLELNSAFFVNRDSPLWPQRDRLAQALAAMTADGTNRRIVDTYAAARP